MISHVTAADLAVPCVAAALSIVRQNGYMNTINIIIMLFTIIMLLIEYHACCVYLGMPVYLGYISEVHNKFSFALRWGRSIQSGLSSICCCSCCSLLLLKLKNRCDVV